MMMSPAQAVYMRIMMSPDMKPKAPSEAPCGLVEEGLSNDPVKPEARYHDSDDPAKCVLCRDDYEQRMKGELDG